MKTKVITPAKPSRMKESAVVVLVAKTSLVPASRPSENTEISKKAQVFAKAPGKKNILSFPVDSMPLNAKIK